MRRESLWALRPLVQIVKLYRVHRWELLQMEQTAKQEMKVKGANNHAKAIWLSVLMQTVKLCKIHRWKFVKWNKNQNRKRRKLMEQICMQE
jgi:hypothetical protein